MSVINDQYIRLLDAFNTLRQEIYSEEYHKHTPSHWRIQQAAVLVSQIAMNIASSAGQKLKPPGETSEKPYIKPIT